MRRARLISLCCILAAVPARATAQWQVTADAGVAHLRQSGHSRIQRLDTRRERRGARRRRVVSVERSSRRAPTRIDGRRRALPWRPLLGPVAALARASSCPASVSGFSETSAQRDDERRADGARAPRTDRHSVARSVLGVGHVRIDGSGGALYHAQGDVWRIAGDDRVHRNRCRS